MTTDLTVRVPFRQSQTILEAPAHPEGRGQENSRGWFSCDAINPGNRAATQISVNCDPYGGRTQKKSCIAGSRHCQLVHGMVAALVSGAGKFALEPSSTNTQWVESTMSVR